MRVLYFIIPLAFPFVATADTNNSKPSIQDDAQIMSPVVTNQRDIITSHFQPAPRRTVKINYDTWDAFLKKTVLPTGLSTRKYASTDFRQTGTRIKSGHASKLRLEGNKIILSRFTKGHKDSVRNFREELELIANDHDITSFSKPEQLAFWINLHNAALMEILAVNYPLKKPSEFVVPDSNALLHDAKILIIKNMPLSLRDIREKIVYPHWNDPKVFYGFSRGDIASPSLQNSAYTSENIDALLEAGAQEFTNSLRGYRSGKVSKLYQELSPFYFQDFEKDLSVHLKKYMRDEVKSELAEHGIQGTSPYEKGISDVVGGTGNRTVPMSVTSYEVEGGRFGSVSLGGATSDGNAVASNTHASNMRQLHGTIGAFDVDLSKKKLELERMGLASSGTVTIEDMEPSSTKSDEKID